MTAEIQHLQNDEDYYDDDYDYDEEEDYYKEVFDKKESFSEKARKRLIRCGAKILLIAAFCGAVISIGILSLWTLLVLPISIIAGLAALIILIFTSSEPQKYQYASVIKKEIGFDFGDDFRLFRHFEHDTELYEYIFSESSFEPLKMHLNTIPDEGSPDEGSINGVDYSRYICHHYNKDGQCCEFILKDRRLKYGGGNIESIWVDYEKRTLLHSFIIY